MIHRLSARILLGALSIGMIAFWLRAETNTPASGNGGAAATTSGPVQPGIADGRITWLSAKMLETLHFSRQPFDNSLSSKFLDRYLKTLDPQRIHFTQGDIDGFEKYRATLDDLTANRKGVADPSPAFEMFNRFVQRLQERAAYAEDLLRNEKFSFETDEKIVVDREGSPYPKDQAEATKLWRERVQFEYLQEMLGKIAEKEKASKTAAKNAAKEGTSGAEPPAAEAKPKKSDHEQIVETLRNRYQRNLKTFRDFDNDDVLQVYLSALAHVYDPHSDYLGHDQLESFTINMNLSLFGIGAELRSVDGYCTINRLLPGGPALKSGKIKEKDRIIAVAQGDGTPVDVVDMSLSKAVQLIRGPKGTEVRLTVVPDGADNSSSKIVTLIRDEIPLEEQAAKAKIIETTGASGDKLRLGVIDLPSFYASFDPSNSRNPKAEPKSTTADVAKLLEKLKQEGVGGVVLDLRRNGGGSLEEAIRLTGLFIKRGPVVQVKGSEGPPEIDGDGDPSIAYDGPLIVLTSRFTASASEILAGALQDYGRALVVGDSSTHGKGTVQSVNSLKPYLQLPRSFTNDPGAIKVTIKKFYRASGPSTQLRGVVPDIILPSVLSESEDLGESSLDNALPGDTIASAEYEYLNRVAPYLAELRRRSGERVEKDSEFGYIREDIALYKKQKADKTLSLNLKQRLKEKEESEARTKTRDKERLARAESADVVYEITLKLADKPGLPPPVEKTNSVAKASSPHPGFELAAYDGAEDDSEEKPPAVDAAMAEAQRILKDYVSLSSHANLAATSRREAPIQSGNSADKAQVVR